jgi:hypothetical protein
MGRKRLASVQSAGHLLTKHLALRFCVRAARSPGARPWPLAAYGDLGRRPTLPNPHGAFSPRKGVIAHPFHPHSQMGTRRAPPPCTPWQLIQLGPERGLPLSGHSKAGTTRRLSLRPVRRLRRLIRDRHNKHFRWIAAIRAKCGIGQSWAPSRLAAMRQQGCSESAPYPSCQMTAASPITTFIQGAAKALLRARKASRKRTFKSAQLTQAMLRPASRSAKRRL